MVQRRASKSMPAMTSRIREVEGHSRAHRRVPSPRRRSPRREDFQRTSRAPARSSREVSEVLRSRSSGPVCCSRCRSRRSASPVRCPTHRHGRATSPVRCTVHSPTRRHRALEERNSISSTEPILNERHREDEEYSRARRHRVFEREPRAEDEGYHKKTIGSRVCKAAKLVSGFLISMGLVLVFYVIITTIMGESSALDIFNFEFGTEDILKHNENVTNSTFLTDLKRNEPVLEVLLESDSHKIESQDSGTYNKDDLSSGESPVWKPDEEREDTALRDMSVEGTNKTDAEGRSYMSYIPVPPSDEDDEEEKQKGKETRSPSHPNSMYVPMMFLPGGGGPNLSPNGRPNLGLLHLRSSSQSFHPQGLIPDPSLMHRRVDASPIHRGHGSPHVLPDHQLSSLPPRPPGYSQNPRLPPAVRRHNSLPLIPAGRPRQPSGVFGNDPTTNILRMSGGQQAFSFNLGHSVGGGQAVGNSGHPVKGRPGQHSSLTSSYGNDGSYSSNGNSVYSGNNAFAEDPINEMDSINGMSPIHGMNAHELNSMNRMNNMNERNNGIRNVNGMSRVEIGMDSTKLMNNINGTNSGQRTNTRTSGFSAQATPSAGQNIWNSLFEIMNRPGEGSNTFPGGMETMEEGEDEVHPMGGSAESLRPARIGMLPPGQPVPVGLGVNSIANLPPPSDGPPGPQALNAPRPDPPRSYHGRPRLPPSSRMSGPLPQPFPRPHPPFRPRPQPLPRYRYRPQPGPPHPGLLRVPRRPPPQSLAKHRPPKEFQYPPDSGSIQDIIQYMNSDEHQEGRVRAPPGYIIGNQDHIIGPNPFGNIYVEETGDVDFSDAAQSDFNNGDSHSSNGGNNYSENRFHTGGNHYNGVLGGVRNGNVVSGGGSINGFNNGVGTYVNGGNNFNNGNDFNNGGHNFNEGSNYHSGNNNNAGVNSFNTVGYDSQNTGGSFLSSVQNTYSSNTGKSKPFNIVLDVYPMDDTSVASGPKPFQTSISLPSDSNQAGRFSPEDNANRHEIILHLNLYSKTPTGIRRHGSSGEIAASRSGAVSLEVPLTGQLSPLDIYRAVVNKARSQTPQAQAQVIQEKEGTSGSGDGAEIELFDVEEGPLLLQAIEQGLRDLNASLPPHQRFVFTE